LKRRKTHAHEQLALEEVVLKVVALRVGHVLLFCLVWFWFLRERGRSGERRRQATATSGDGERRRLIVFAGTRSDGGEGSGCRLASVLLTSR
jgi:hypothetical protein